MKKIFIFLLLAFVGNKTGQAQIQRRVIVVMLTRPQPIHHESEKSEPWEKNYFIGFETSLHKTGSLNAGLEFGREETNNSIWLFYGYPFAGETGAHAVENIPGLERSGFLQNSVSFGGGYSHSIFTISPEESFMEIGFEIAYFTSYTSSSDIGEKKDWIDVLKLQEKIGEREFAFMFPVIGYKTQIKESNFFFISSIGIGALFLSSEAGSWGHAKQTADLSLGIRYLFWE